ncbi:MAG: 6,7-dimethyl-8-ribityllumazine synthase [Candidatus Omnitrophica bacterium]|nr:6,7-dimethyl-8-ribityllumazine synthase [Candidatus Omnitrophota bacterium]
MTKILEGKSIGRKRRVGIVASRFNGEITERLLKGCLAELVRAGVKKENITVTWVPGAFEIPFVAQELIVKKKNDGVIALGAVIRGETAHFDYVSSGLVQGIMKVQLVTRSPIAFGVLTTNTDRQALERSGGKHGNKGREAAEVLLQILNLKDQI